MKKVSDWEEKGEFNFFVMPKKSLYNMDISINCLCREYYKKMRYENVANCTKKLLSIFPSFLLIALLG